LLLSITGAVRFVRDKPLIAICCKNLEAEPQEMGSAVELGRNQQKSTLKKVP
jgi:hypothetical protein